MAALFCIKQDLHLQFLLLWLQVTQPAPFQMGVQWACVVWVKYRPLHQFHMFNWNANTSVFHQVLVVLYGQKDHCSIHCFDLFCSKWMGLMMLPAPSIRRLFCHLTECQDIPPGTAWLTFFIAQLHPINFTLKINPLWFCVFTSSEYF